MSHGRRLLERTRAQIVAWLRMRRDLLRMRWVCHRVRRRLPLRGPRALRVPDEGRELFERFRGLSTNRANHLRLQLDRTMRPTELQGLLLAYLAGGNRSWALEEWLCETGTDAPSLLWSPAVFAPPLLLEGGGDVQLRWYRRAAPAPGSAPGSRAERLVIAFTSNANAVCVIGPCFLQWMDPFAADVLLVTRADPHGHGFFLSGEGPAASRLGLVCGAVARLLERRPYRQVVCVGYSGGAFAAATAAAALGAERGVALGGWPPQRQDLAGATWLEGLIASLPPLSRRVQRTHLLFCAAGGNASDRQGVLESLRRSADWSRPGLSREGRAYRGCRDHNQLVELQRRGHPLLPLLTDLLFPDDPVEPPRRRRWRPARHDPLIP